jgi:hypothetical protein
MSVSAVAALRGHEMVFRGGFSVAALVNTSLAWLLIVRALGPEFTGHLPVRQRQPGRDRYSESRCWPCWHSSLWA